jgi:hypothetical protein
MNPPQRVAISRMFATAAGADASPESTPQGSPSTPLKHHLLSRSVIIDQGPPALRVERIVESTFVDARSPELLKCQAYLCPNLLREAHQAAKTQLSPFSFFVLAGNAGVLYPNIVLPCTQVSIQFLSEKSRLFRVRKVQRRQSCRCCRYWRHSGPFWLAEDRALCGPGK